MPSSFDSEHHPVVATINEPRVRSRPIGWFGFGLLLAGFLLTLVARPELRIRIVLLVTSCFAAAAWLLRGVTLGGAVAGFLATTLMFLAAGPPLFGAVLLVFVLTYGATRFGRNRKRAMHIAERPSGRDAAQVLANIGVAALCAALAQMTALHLPLLAGSVAALAEAGCDTVSSEAGKVLTESQIGR